MDRFPGAWAVKKIAISKYEASNTPDITYGVSNTGLK
jgi:hypothetical protein